VQLANALALASSKKLTSPVGVVGAVDVSVTVAVHVVDEPTGTDGGVQLTVVMVVCFAGRNATSCATQAAPVVPSVADLGPVGPAVACVKSALIECVWVAAPPAPPELTWNRSVMPTCGVSVVLRAIP
jgi:hypothetical protein